MPADRLPPMAHGDMTAEQRQAVQEISAGPRGALIGPFVPLLRSPELMTRIQKVGEHLRFGTVLEQDILELTILTVAREWEQGFEWGFHRPLAERAGVPDAVIEALAEGREPTSLTGDQAVAYAVARQLQRSAPRGRGHLRPSGRGVRRGRVRRAGGDSGVLHDPGDGHERGADATSSTGRRAETADRRAVTAAAGPPAEEAALVLLHPLGADHEFWDPLTRALAGRPVHALDLPGHGRAPLPSGGLTIARAAEAVLAELDRDGAGRVDLLGLSIGGLVAQYIAAHAPERVAHLVLADTVARYPEPFRQQWRARARAARTEGTASFVEPTLQTWFTPDFARSEAEAVRYARAAIARCDPEGYAQACEALEAVDAGRGSRGSPSPRWSCAAGTTPRRSARRPTGWRSTSPGPSWNGFPAGTPARWRTPVPSRSSCARSSARGTATSPARCGPERAGSGGQPDAAITSRCSRSATCTSVRRSVSGWPRSCSVFCRRLRTVCSCTASCSAVATWLVRR